PRRGRPRRRRRARGDRGRGGDGRPRADRASEALGRRQLGRRRPASRRDRGARQRGLPVDCDAYPYDTATNPLRNLLPRWVMDGGIAAMLERLGNRDVRTRLRDDIARAGLTNFGRIPSWDVVRVAVSPHLPEHAGRTLGDIARGRNVDPFEAVCDFVIADRGETRILITSMADPDVREITRAPWILAGS